MGLEGLSVAERAERLGISFRELGELGKLDPRIMDARTLPNEGSIDRLFHWLAAGRPEADMSTLSFIGGSRVECALREALKLLPAPVRHHAVSVIAFVGIEPHERAWSAAACFEAPRPSHDRAHMVVLHADDLPTIAHEIAHSWHRPISIPGTPQKTAAEMEVSGSVFRDALAKACVEAGSVEKLVRHSLQVERIADRSATCWLGVCVDTISQARIAHVRGQIFNRAQSAESTKERDDDHEEKTAIAAAL